MPFLPASDNTVYILSSLSSRSTSPSCLFSILPLPRHAFLLLTSCFFFFFSSPSSSLQPRLYIIGFPIPRFIFSLLFSLLPLFASLLQHLLHVTLGPLLASSLFSLTLVSFCYHTRLSILITFATCWTGLDGLEKLESGGEKKKDQKKTHDRHGKTKLYDSRLIKKNQNE